MYKAHWGCIILVGLAIFAIWWISKQSQWMNYAASPGTPAIFNSVPISNPVSYPGSAGPFGPGAPRFHSPIGLGYAP